VNVWCQKRCPVIHLAGNYTNNRVLNSTRNCTSLYTPFSFSSEPQGDLALSSSNILYGIAFGGGASDSGCIFSIDANGAYYHNLHNFTGLTGGCLSYGAATLSGKNLYGMTCFGGTYGRGTIFTFNDTTTNSHLGISELVGMNGELMLYPNPNNGIFTLSYHSESGEESLSKIEVYNILGKEVFTGILYSASNNNRINMSSQSAGIYLYRVMSNSGELIGHGKLIIQK
jgi:uncharacterized repeat protein (TIGR03803 family)